MSSLHSQREAPGAFIHGSYFVVVQGSQQGQRGADILQVAHGASDQWSQARQCILQVEGMLFSIPSLFLIPWKRSWISELHIYLRHCIYRWRQSCETSKLRFTRHLFGSSTSMRTSACPMPLSRPRISFLTTCDTSSQRRPQSQSRTLGG